MEYELIVRKTISQFIEKIFRYHGYDFNHNEYKKVVYNEREALNNTEEKLKCYYDAYMYLLNNSKTIFTNSLIKKFFYILKESVIDEAISNKIINSYFYLNEEPIIEKAIHFHFKVKDILYNYDELDKMIIPIMFLNYVLVKNDKPTFRFSLSEVKMFDNLKDEKEIFLFIYNKITNSKYYEKSYFENLKPLSTSDIYNAFKQDEELLKNDYHLKGMILYGSFSKGEARIDSDIDLFVRINDDLLVEEKIKIIEALKTKYKEIFKRNVDIEEISNYLSDSLLKEINKIKIIF